MDEDVEIDVGEEEIDVGGNEDGDVEVVDNDAAPEENGEGEGYEDAADEANGNGDAQDGDWEEGEGGEGGEGGDGNWQEGEGGEEGAGGQQQGVEGEEIDEEIEQMAVEELEREIGKVRRQIAKLETDLENEDDSGLLSFFFELLADNCSIHLFSQTAMK